MRTGDVWGKLFGYSGKGWFNEYGDVVTICYDDADGEAVAMYVYYDRVEGNPMYSFNVGGEGNCKTRKAGMGGKYNLKENQHYGFLFCRYDEQYGSSECWSYRIKNDH